MDDYGIDMEVWKDIFDAFSTISSKVADIARDISEALDDLYDAMPDEIKEAMSEDG